MNPAGDNIGVVPEERAMRSASRYDALVATFVGICALCVSGYTAYMQRQQVRAAVWPILEFDTSNQPDIHLTLANKGVGPAIIRHVIVTVDGQPVSNWNEALARLLGPGTHWFSESDMSGHVLAANESMTILTPTRDPEGTPIVHNRSDPLWMEVNKARGRIAVEICYSTLGECWTLRSGGGQTATSTTETRRCPSSSATSFQQ